MRKKALFCTLLFFIIFSPDLLLARFLKESSGPTIMTGPFLDDSDGKTPETGLTISQSDVLLSKEGGAFEQKHESTACTHDQRGYYRCPLDSTDTNFPGILSVDIQISGALPVFHEYIVLKENVYDSLCGSDKLEVDVTTMAAGVITSTVLATDCITNDEIAATAATEIIDDFETQSQADPTGFHVNVLELNGTAQTALDVGDYTYAIWVDTDAVDTSTEIRTLLTGSDTAVSTITTAQVNTEADTALTEYDPPTKAEMDTAHGLLATEAKQDTIDTNVDAILVDTSAYDTDAEYATALWNAATASYGGAGTYGQSVEDTLTYALSSAAWGSINSGIVFRGVVTADDPAVSFTISGLAGQGAGAFIDANTPWYAYVFRDGGGAAAAPQGEIQQVTGYTSATGLFTTNAFTTPVATGDDIVIMSGRLSTIPDILTYVDDLETRIPGAITISGGVVEANIVQVQDDAVPDNGDGFLEVNVTEIEDQLLSSNVGGNFEVFFENGGGVTTKTVNDVGVAGSGLSAAQVWAHTTRTLTALDEDDTTIDLDSTSVASTTGPGATEATLTIKDANGNALDNIKVWVTTDTLGTNVYAGPLYTAADGTVDFTVDTDVTYYVWREHAGYTFSNPQTWTPAE